MKRILSLALATIMCLSLVLVLGSCDLLGKYIPFFNKEEDKEEDKEEETVYTVTEEQWDAAMAEVNYTAEGNAETFVDQKMNVGDQEQHNAMHLNMSFVQKNTAESRYYWCKTVSDPGTAQEVEDEDTNYMALKNGVWYIINQDDVDGSWYSSEHSDYEVETISSQILIDEFEYGFSDFTYNEEKKAYELNKELEDGFMLGGIPNSPPDSTLSITLWFEDGNLVKAEVTLEESLNTSGEGYTINAEVLLTGTFVFKDLGTTVIELPEYTLD